MGGSRGGAVTAAAASGVGSGSGSGVDGASGLGSTAHSRRRRSDADDDVDAPPSAFATALVAAVGHLHLAHRAHHRRLGRLPLHPVGAAAAAPPSVGAVGAAGSTVAPSVWLRGWRQQLGRALCGSVLDSHAFGPLVTAAFTAATHILFAPAPLHPAAFPDGDGDALPDAPDATSALFVGTSFTPRDFPSLAKDTSADASTAAAVTGSAGADAAGRAGRRGAKGTTKVHQL